jgi:4-amino-4-deoxy-L-arabinose transferase-like glycosyltransferase
MVSSTQVEPEPTDRHEAEPVPGSGARSGGRRFWWALAAIAVVGGIWRFAYTYYYRSNSVLSDGVAYSYGARLLTDGKGFINPLGVMMNGSEIQDGVHPPAWTMFLAIFSFLGRESDLDFRYAAAAVGVATVVMTGLAARAAFGNRVGLIAAALAAVYPNIWLYEHELVSEPLALLGISTLLWCAFRFRARPSVGWAIGLGAVVAVCALTRAELILMSALIVAPTILLARRFTWGRRIGLLAISGAACLAFIGPWFAYNTTRFSEPVPLSAGLGGVLTAGNCDVTFDPSSEYFAYYHFGCAIYSGKVSEEPSLADVQRRQNAMRYISAHKRGFVITATARVGRAFSFYAPFQQVGFEGERGTTTWVISAGLWTYWLLVPFAVYGFVVARRRKVPVYPFVALFGVVVVAVGISIGAVRYRAPFEIALVMLAAAGIDAVLRRLTGRRSATPDGADAAAGDDMTAADDAAAPDPGALSPSSSGPAPTQFAREVGARLLRAGPRGAPA